MVKEGCDKVNHILHQFTQKPHYFAEEQGAPREQGAGLPQSPSGHCLAGSRESSRMQLYLPCRGRTRMAFSSSSSEQRATQQGPWGHRGSLRLWQGLQAFEAPQDCFAMALKAATRNSRSPPCQGMHQAWSSMGTGGFSSTLRHFSIDPLPLRSESHPRTECCFRGDKRLKASGVPVPRGSVFRVVFVALFPSSGCIYLRKAGPAPWLATQAPKP